MKNESTISTKGQVTIPAKFRKELGLEPQDKIRFEREGGNVSYQTYSQAGSVGFVSVGSVF